MAGQHLAKSRYMAGLQCARWLWLLVHEPPSYADPAPGSPLDVGYEIGRKAHLLFPGDTLVEEEPWQHAAVVRRTTALMADPTVHAVSKAASEHDDTIYGRQSNRSSGDFWTCCLSSAGAMYLPAFLFSNSIKSVAPALSPGFGSADLDGVADGMAASAAFIQLASGTVSDSIPLLTTALAD